MKLKVGDVIEVHGWVMMEKMEKMEKMEGLLRVKSCRTVHGCDAYDFSRPRGKKTIISHYAHNVDPRETTRCSIISPAKSATCGRPPGS